MGSIKRRDRLVRGLNQAAVEVEFWSPLRAVYPSAQRSAENEIAAAVADFDVAAAQAFGDVVGIATMAQRVGLKSSMLQALGEIRGALQSLAEPMSSVSRAFYDAESVLNAGMDTFVGTPLLLGQQFLNLVGIPSRIIGGLERPVLCQSGPIRSRTRFMGLTWLQWRQSEARCAPVLRTVSRRGRRR